MADMGPEVIVERMEIDGDVISIAYALRSEQKDQFGRDHIVRVRAGAIPTEATELYEALVAVVEAVEILDANPPATIPRTPTPVPWGGGGDS